MFEPLLGHGKAIAVEMFPQPRRCSDSCETTTNQSGRLEVVERKENEDPMDELCWQIFKTHVVDQFIFVFGSEKTSENTTDRGNKPAEVSLVCDRIYFSAR